jgi:hypothetical protein
MEVGLIISWGKAVPGREREAIGLFTESKDWFEGKYKAGWITYYEPYFYATGDFEAEAGFWLVRGERDKIWKLTEDETFRWLSTKAQFYLDHFEVQWLTVGEGIPEQVERLTKLVAEMAPVH